MILDSKRGDIGSTAAKYAQESFERYGADAVTVNPYLGFDSVEPYLKWQDRGVIILCRTSNPGARDFQDLESGGKRAVSPCGRARGARLECRRQLHAGDWRDLSAGAGGDPRGASATCRSWCRAWARRAVTWPPRCAPAAPPMDSGMVLNSSRGILYASGGEDFAAAARAATRALRDEINRYR